MSMKSRGKKLEKSIVRGSETLGRDVKRAGKKVGKAARSGMARAGNRLKVHSRTKTRTTIG
ncbi:MAG: hypothetical protein WB778_10195 [Thermoplasmata archaeon]|jgi:hypothetical protein